MNGGWRSIRVGYPILLVAMAIQGLTPDHGDLASPRLLRHVISELAGSRSAEGGPSPSPVSVPRGEDDGAPGEICTKVDVRALRRAGLDAGFRPWAGGSPMVGSDRPTRSVRVPRSILGVVVPGPDALILSLCRLLC